MTQIFFYISTDQKQLYLHLYKAEIKHPNQAVIRSSKSTDDMWPRGQGYLFKQIVPRYYLCHADTTNSAKFKGVCRGHDCIVVGFITTYAISAYHH
jgi:hypothetical protein